MNINMSFGNGHGKVKFTMDNMIRLQDALKKKYATRVGIIGSAEHEPRNIAAPRREAMTTKAGERKPSKTASEVTNAAIGALHEKGDPSRNIPRRSWLEIPIFLHLEDNQQYLATSMFAALRGFDLKPFFVKLGIAGEKTVQEAFDTSGWGSWPPPKWRQGSPLIDTGQLRKAVTSAVVTK